MSQAFPTISPILSALRNISSASFPNMTFSQFNERHPHHANTWPSYIPFQTDGIDPSSWHIDAMGPESIDPSHSQSGDTNRSQSHDTSQSDMEGGERDQAQEDPSTSGEATSPPAIDPSSSTPNARASRLFRERRKERERILRETVAELVERNAALEALLLRHGTVPPPAITLRHDLSLQRSQSLGGPPIHIPGVTEMRPPMTPSLSEPSNLYCQPSTCGPQPFGDPSVAPSQPPSTLQEGGRSSRIEEQHDIGRWGMPPAISDSLPAACNLVQSTGEVARTSSSNSSYSIASHSHQQPQPITMVNRSTSSNQTTGPLPTQHNLYGSSKTGPADAVLTHTRTPSDSALLAKLPALTPAEQRIIAARGGDLPGHFLPMAMLAEGLPTSQVSCQQQPQQLQGQHSAPQVWIPHPSADPTQRDTRPFSPNAAIPGASVIEAASPSRGRTTASDHQSPHLGSIASDFVPSRRGGPYSLSPTAISAISLLQPAARREPHSASPATCTFAPPDGSQMPPSLPCGPPLAAQSQSHVSSQSQTQSDDPIRTYTAHYVLEKGETEADGEDDEQAQSRESEDPSSPLLYEPEHLTEEGKAVSRSLERTELWRRDLPKLAASDPVAFHQLQ
ncbi:uncharacterized protein UTRI_05805 [Ustilago trichophora]|uniref:BZIP domain-containing protein n=1 Tax=Ustilago trichophora TaxID=86804 RepID=A0A5C3ELE9_9BASI|nr:uncharacterized protein UTRI_05805 [Ustilago trichophora]